jgi:hypothetical protein
MVKITDVSEEFTATIFDHEEDGKFLENIDTMQYPEASAMNIDDRENLKPHAQT